MTYKYKKPYYDGGPKHRALAPLPMVTVGLSLFLQVFADEITDTASWAKQPTLSQLILHRTIWLFSHTDQIPELRARARPFVALAEEAYATDAPKTVQIYNEIMVSYAEIQHSAFARDSSPNDSDDYVNKFNRLFDEYRFRYEELLNRLISFAYGCIGIVLHEPAMTGSDLTYRAGGSGLAIIHWSEQRFARAESSKVQPSKNSRFPSWSRVVSPLECEKA